MKLSKLLAIHPSTVYRWERGETYPSLEIKANLAKIFQVPIDFFDRTETETEKENFKENSIRQRLDALEKRLRVLEKHDLEQ